MNYTCNENYPHTSYFLKVDKFDTILPKTRTLRILLHLISSRRTCTQATQHVYSLTRNTMLIIHLSTSVDSNRFVSSTTQHNPISLCGATQSTDTPRTGTYHIYNDYTKDQNAPLLNAITLRLAHFKVVIPTPFWSQADPMRIGEPYGDINRDSIRLYKVQPSISSKEE